MKYSLPLVFFLFLLQHALSAQIAPAPDGFSCDQIIYAESFESGVPAGWTDLGVDQYKSGASFNEGWVIDRDTTFTTGTGPDGAQDGDFYAYCDGSGPVGRNSEARMLSPLIDIPDVNAPVLTFYLNMYGQSGSFRLNVIPAGGSATTVVPTVNGDVPGGIHGPDVWELIYLDMSAFINQSVQLEFMTNKPSSVNIGDISIDNVTICSSPNTVPTLGEWGIIALFLLLSIFGLVGLRAGVSTPSTSIS